MGTSVTTIPAIEADPTHSRAKERAKEWAASGDNEKAGNMTRSQNIQQLCRDFTDLCAANARDTARRLLELRLPVGTKVVVYGFASWNGTVRGYKLPLDGRVWVEPLPWFRDYVRAAGCEIVDGAVALHIEELDYAHLARVIKELA